MVGCRAGNAAIVRRLLEAGASMQAIDLVGSTALHEAAASGSTECVQLLLAAGACLTATVYLCGVCCNTSALLNPRVIRINICDVDWKHS